MMEKQRQREYNKKYYESHKESEKARSLITSKKRRERVGRERIAEENRAYTQLRKKLVLTHYGNGKCACSRCGESRLACLSIDHIEGGGKEDRGELGGSYFYGWLIKKGYPEGYQTLCMNCNWVKRCENREYRKPK